MKDGLDSFERYTHDTGYPAAALAAFARRKSSAEVSRTPNAAAAQPSGAVLSIAATWFRAIRFAAAGENRFKIPPHSAEDSSRRPLHRDRPVHDALIKVNHVDEGKGIRRAEVVSSGIRSRQSPGTRAPDRRRREKLRHIINADERVAARAVARNHRDALLLDAVLDPRELAVGECKRPEHCRALRAAQRDFAAHHCERGVHEDAGPEDHVIEPAALELPFRRALGLEQG
jgi:hypothetical protein